MHPRISNPWRWVGWGAGAALLLLPLVAMQFTDEVKWDLADFMFAGALVVGVGVSYELAVRKTGSRACRAGVAIALATAFVLVWANAAVGIIGSQDNPANAMFHGVPAAGIGPVQQPVRGIEEFMVARQAAQPRLPGGGGGHLIYHCRLPTQDVPCAFQAWPHRSVPVAAAPCSPALRFSRPWPSWPPAPCGAKGT
jgi:hypothetical protein